MASDPLLPGINFFKQLDDLVLVRVCVTSSRRSIDCLHQVAATLPRKGSIEDCAAFISAVRAARDAYTQKRGEISQDLRTAQELMRLHELRLSQTVRVLSAVEGLLGEVRARFRAKGIPTVDP